MSLPLTDFHLVDPRLSPCPGVVRALELLAAVEKARLVCAEVAEETGGLLPDDACAVELRDAERALDAYDAAHGLPRRSYVRKLEPHRPHRGERGGS